MRDGAAAATGGTLQANWPFPQKDNLDTVPYCGHAAVAAVVATLARSMAQHASLCPLHQQQKQQQPREQQMHPAAQNDLSVIITVHA